MHIRKFLFLFPALLLFPLSEMLANRSGQMFESTSLLPTECELPAPTNFHTEYVGPNKVMVAWDQPPTNPFEYNIKVYLSGGAIPVQDFNIAGNKVSHLIENLTSNKKYLIVLTPLCEGGDEGKSASLEVLTIITELVVIGFSPATNMVEPTCLLQNTIAPCSLNLHPNYFATFRLEKSGSTEHYPFGVYYGGPGCVAVLEPTTTNSKKNGDYYMLCNNIEHEVPIVSEPDCPGNSFSIFSNINNTSTKVAEIEVSEGSGFAVFFRVTMLAPGFSIARMGSINGQAAPFEHYCGNIEQRTGFNNDDSQILTTQSFSASPNPFTNQLEIRIPHATESGSTELFLYDLQGRQILAGYFPGGQQTITWSTTALTPGMYFLRAQSGGIVQTIKVVKTQ